jgi:hypothetical protein
VKESRIPIDTQTSAGKAGLSNAALLLGVILAFLGAGCGGSGTLGATALSQQAKAVQSDAAEGVLLAQDVVSGKTTRIYAREHSADLYKEAFKAEASLKAATSEHTLRPTLRRLAALAVRVSADLNRLGHASPEEARTLGHELQAAAEESRKIGEGLG